MYFKRFNIGDQVSYRGKKFHSSLFGKRGVIVSRVQNENSAVVVDFGLEDAFVLDENLHLTSFRGKVNEDGLPEKKEPDVQKKRSNRKVVNQFESSEDE